MVWIESTISSAGLDLLRRRQDGRDVGLGQDEQRVVAERGPVRPELDLLGRLLAGDIEDRAPVRAMSVAACRTRVDLPMPGSPPSRTSDPARIPRRGPGSAPRSRPGAARFALVAESPSRTGVAPVGPVGAPVAPEVEMARSSRPANPRLGNSGNVRASSG